MMAALVPSAASGEGPFPDGTRVYMDELASGVITDAAGAERERSVAQLSRGNAGDSEIERRGFNVF